MPIRRTDIHKRLRVTKAVLGRFAEEIEKVAKIALRPGGKLIDFPWEELSGSLSEDAEVLLKARKMLAAEIKTGMLERQNREAEIALFAMVVWFRRLDAERRAKAAGLSW